MAASFPPAPSSTPATPSGSNHETEATATMAASTGASTAASPSKSGSLPALEKEEDVATAAAVEASIEKPPAKKRGSDRNSKPKPKKKEKAQCVGYYVDALDKKMLWGEARIIQCNPTTQKIKVHFVGWSKNYDLWTDVMSITEHGRYAPRTKKDKSVKSWHGDMHLFEDMLGPIEEASFTPIPVPAEEKSPVSSSSVSAQKKGAEKKEGPGEKKKNLGKKKLKGKTAALAPARQPERSAPKRKAAVGSEDKVAIKNTVATAKPIESNGHRQEPVRSSKRATATVQSKESTEEKQAPVRSSKRQKREVQQPATVPTTAKARPSKKKRAAELPLFRDLELDDGTVIDFSVQREEARAEREAMQGFLDKCALIWKQQLSAVTVQ